MRLMALILCMVSVSGCVTTPPLSTPSGRPEVLIPNASVSDVKAKIIADLMSAGATLAQDTPYMLTFVKESNDVMASALLGSRYDSRVMMRTRFTLAQERGGVHVYASEELVSNYGSAFERTTALSGKSYHDAQNYLESLRYSLSSSK